MSILRGVSFSKIFSSDRANETKENLCGIRFGFFIKENKWDSGHNHICRTLARQKRLFRNDIYFYYGGVL